MAESRAGLAELHLGVIAAYLALLEAVAETLAGDPAAAERAVRDAEARIPESGDRWYLSSSRSISPTRSSPRATWPTPPRRSRIETLRGALRHRVDDQAPHRAGARSRLGGRARTRAAGRARGGRRSPRRPGSSSAAPTPSATLAELLWATGCDEGAAAAVRRALALDEAKGKRRAAAATRQRFAALLGSPAGAPGA